MEGSHWKDWYRPETEYSTDIIPILMDQKIVTKILSQSSFLYFSESSDCTMIWNVLEVFPLISVNNPIGRFSLEILEQTRDRI